MYQGAPLDRNPGLPCGNQNFEKGLPHWCPLPVPHRTAWWLPLHNKSYPATSPWWRLETGWTVAISRLRAAKGDGRSNWPPNSWPHKKRGSETQWFLAVECTVVKEVMADSLWPCLLRPRYSGPRSSKQDTAPYAWGNEVVRGRVSPRKSGASAYTLTLLRFGS